MTSRTCIRSGSVVFLFTSLSLMTGCDLLGPGKKDADFKIPKEKRVLIFVDTLPTINPPAGMTALLGQRIGDLIVKYKGAVDIVAQQRLTDLRRNDPKFAEYGIADIAKKTDSDIVIYINLVGYNVDSLSDSSITQGLAQVIVKAVDSNGKRLYPTADSSGVPVQVKIDPAFTSDQTVEKVNNQIVDLLSIRVSRMFFEYEQTDEKLNK